MLFHAIQMWHIETKMPIAKLWYLKNFVTPYLTQYRRVQLQSLLAAEARSVISFLSVTRDGMRRDTHVEDGDDEGEEEKVEVRVGEDRLHFIGVLLREPYKCHVRNPKARSTYIETR